MNPQEQRLLYGSHYHDYEYHEVGIVFYQYTFFLRINKIFAFQIIRGIHFLIPSNHNKLKLGFRN